MKKLEAEIQAEILLEAPRRGVTVWRNNCGLAWNKNGRPVRFGLCNVSEAMNNKIKSSDLIGITPTIITPDMVGTTVGVFTAYETKKEGWVYKSPTKREKAQKKFLDLVKSLGGIAKFITGKEGI